MRIIESPLPPDEMQRFLDTDLRHPAHVAAGDDR